LFENKVPRVIFGRKGEEGTGGWRTLDSEELHDLYASPDIIRVIKYRREKCARACVVSTG
jgi:hypothetical protein